MIIKTDEGLAAVTKGPRGTYRADRHGCTYNYQAVLKCTSRALRRKLETSTDKLLHFCKDRVCGCRTPGISLHYRAVAANPDGTLVNLSDHEGSRCGCVGWACSIVAWVTVTGFRSVWAALRCCLCCGQCQQRERRTSPTRPR